jgi:hypothetical protein
MPNKRIEQVCQTTDINGNDKLLVVKSGSNVTRSVTVDNFIHENSINTGEICNCAITEPKIGDCAITTRHLKASIITSDNIDTAGITADCITTGTLDASNVTVINLDASNITTGTLDANRIGACSITTDKLVANAVTTDKIAANSITTDTLAANSINTDILAANAVTTDTLAANAITADKISNGTIASESMIASNIITAQSISSDAIITGSIQSKNFDGSYNTSTGLIGAGTEGFYLEGNTGTIIANTLVARDDIITGNMIKFSDGKALQANPETGALEVIVDDDTLSIQNGKLAIKTLPSTAVYSPVGSVTYSGATTEKEIGTYSRGDGSTYSSIIQAGNTVTPYAGRAIIATGTYIQAAASLFTIDLLDHVTGPGAVTSINLYNITFEVDYTNIANLANIQGLCYLAVLAVPSDSLDGFVNVSGARSPRFFQISNPTFPAAKVDYTLNNISVKPPLHSTNRYIHLFPGFSFANGGPDYTPFNSNDTISIKVKASTDMRLTLNATGTIQNPNRSMQHLLDTTPENDYWVDGQGFSYDDSVFN